MFKFLFLSAIAAMAAMMTGCCGGPIGFATGPGSHCGYCEGAPSGPSYHQGPLARLAAAHKRTVCGSGCGEVYYGEWLSNPPDCCDPCDNEVQCTPPIVPQCGIFARMFAGLYGVRHPRGGGGAGCCEETCVDDCGSCDSCCGGGGEVIHEGPVVESGPGCSSCAGGSHGNIPFATKPVRRAPYTRGGQPQTVSQSRTIRR